MADNKDQTKYDSWSSISIDEDVVYNHKINIANFKKVVDNYPFEKFLKCDPIVIPLKDKDISLGIRLYPCGFTSTDNGVSYEDSLTLKVNVIEQECVRVASETAIIDRDGKKRKVKEWKAVVKPNVSLFLVLYKLSDITAEGSSLLDTNGNLTFAVKFTILQNNTTNRSVTMRDDSVEDNTSLSKQMMNMLENAEDYFSDMEIECLDGNIPCHSNILASKTPVLKAMFTADMLEARTRKVNMKSLTKEMVFTILTFIYTGKIDTEDINLVILKEADKLGIIDLVTECSKHLSKHLDVTNCVATIILADRIVNTNILKMAAKQFILDNLTTKVMQDIKKDCDKDLMMELLEESNKNGPPAKRRRTDEVLD